MDKNKINSENSKNKIIPENKIIPKNPNIIDKINNIEYIPTLESDIEDDEIQLAILSIMKVSDKTKIK